MHVGTGLGYRFNEERRQRGEEPLPNRHIALWYLAPTLGETFLEAVRTRLAVTYEGGGLWRGRAWGHPVFFLAYRDAPVEADTVPLHLLTAPSPSLVTLLAQGGDLLQRYNPMLFALHPDLWKEIQIMTQASGSTVNYQAVVDYVDVEALVRALGEERVIQAVGVERIVQALGVERIVQALGAERVVQALGVERLIELALGKLTPEQQRQLRLRLPGADKEAP